MKTPGCPCTPQLSSNGVCRDSTPEKVMYPSTLQSRAPPESPLHKVLAPGIRPPSAGRPAQNSFPLGATFSV